MLGRYEAFRRKLDELEISPTTFIGLCSVADGFANARMLQLVLEKFKTEKSKPLDVVCLTHLLYQNLGAAIESIPYRFRDQFVEDLSGVYGITQKGSTKSWVVRSACAHLVSFNQLCDLHSPQLEEQFVDEAKRAMEGLMAVAKKFSPVARFILEQVEEREFEKTLISSNFKLAANAAAPAAVAASDSVAPAPAAGAGADAVAVASVPVAAASTSVFDLLGNCVVVLDVQRQATLNPERFKLSFPSQALSALTLQFVGENARRMFERRESLIAPLEARRRISPDNLDDLVKAKLRRNQMAHQSSIFDQGIGNPDWMLAEVATLQGRLVSFMRSNIEQAQKERAASRGKDEKGDALSAPPKGAAATAPTLARTVSAAVPAAAASEAQPVKKKKQKDKKGQEKRKKFRTELMQRLEGVKRIYLSSDKDPLRIYEYLMGQIKLVTEWNETILLELLSMLTSARMSREADNGTPKELLEVCEFVLEHINLFTKKSIAEFLDTNLPLKLISTQAEGNVYEYNGKVLIRRVIEHFKPEGPSNKDIAQVIYFNLLGSNISQLNVVAAEFFLRKGASPNILIPTKKGELPALEFCVQDPLCGAFIPLLIEFGANLSRVKGKPIAAVAYENGIGIKEVAMLMQCSARNLSANYSVARSHKGKLVQTPNEKDIDFLLRKLRTGGINGGMMLHFGLSKRFMENEDESIYLSLFMLRQMLRREGIKAAYDALERSYIGMSAERSRHGAVTNTHSDFRLSHIYKMKGFGVLPFLLDNFIGVLNPEQSDRFPLHHAIISQSVLAYLAPQPAAAVVKFMQAKPEVPSLPVDKDIYEGGRRFYNALEFAEAIGEYGAVGAIMLCVSLHEVKHVKMIFEYVAHSSAEVLARSSLTDRVLLNDPGLVEYRNQGLSDGSVIKLGVTQNPAAYGRF